MLNHVEIRISKGRCKTERCQRKKENIRDSTKPYSTNILPLLFNLHRYWEQRVNNKKLIGTQFAGFKMNSFQRIHQYDGASIISGWKSFNLGYGQLQGKIPRTKTLQGAGESEPTAELTEEKYEYFKVNLPGKYEGRFPTDRSPSAHGGLLIVFIIKLIILSMICE